MAAALGIGLEVEAPKGSMVVDIGGGTTEIAVISLGGIVIQSSERVAGDVFTSDIQSYLRQQHNIRIGETTAEKIKIAVGAVLPTLQEEPDPYPVKGPNLMTAHPVEATISYQEMAHCLDKIHHQDRVIDPAMYWSRLLLSFTPISWRTVSSFQEAAHCSEVWTPVSRRR